MIEPGKSPSTHDHAPRSRSWQLKYAVSQITTCRTTLEADLAAWREAGVSSIGLWRRKLNDCGMPEAVELIRESGLRVSSLSFAGGFTNMDFMYREAIEDAVEALFTAAAVGARALIIAPGDKARYTPKHQRNMVRDALRDLSYTAAELDVELCVLPLPRACARHWTMLHSLQDTAELLAAVDRPRVSIACDSFHFCRTLEDLGHVAEFLPRIGLIQLSDSVEKPRSEYDRCLPGQGVLPLSDLFRLLEAERYAGVIDLQVWSDALWESEPVSILRACRHSMSGLINGKPVDVTRSAARPELSNAGAKDR